MDIKPVLVKSAIGIVGATGIGVAAHQGFQSYDSQTVRKEKNNIQNKLEKDGYVLLAKDSVHFTEILASYKTVTKNKVELKFGIFTGEAISNDPRKPKDILWEYCKVSFDADMANKESNEALNKAKKWCVEPVTVSEILKKQGNKVFGTDDSSDNDQAKLDVKITKYRRESNSVQGFTGLSIGSGAETITVDHRNNYKGKCNEIGIIKSHEDKYEDNLSIFETWCTHRE